MSIVDEITRLTSAKTNIKAAIEAKGVSVPAAAHLDAFPSYVSAISTGSGDNAWDVFAQRVFPSTIVGSSASYIASSAFQRVTSINSVSYPNVSIVYPSAFMSCSNLTTVDMPNLTSVRDNAFYGCSKLSSITLSKVTVIGMSAFDSCKSMMSLSIPAAVTINMGAFAYCENLSTVYSPKVTKLSNVAFGYCYKLERVDFPAASIISGSAFIRCSMLSVATFGTSDKYASVIGSNAFIQCSKLESIYFGWMTVPNLINVNAFNSTPITNSTYLGHFGSIYVPSSLYDTYVSKANWVNFSSRMVSF